VNQIDMNRKAFLHTLTLLPLTGGTMKLQGLNNMARSLNNSEKMPVLFLGHGSPMNAIEENEFVTGFRGVAREIPRPNAILVVSAHWQTRGTMVTSMETPETIHDFGGFPEELFAVQYPAPGSPSLALEAKQLIKKTEVHLDDKWGLDHGTWSVVKHLYPDATIPVVQMSLDYNQTPQYHYELAQELALLRNKGVLIIGSGNMVHNLRLVAWDKLNADEFAYDWALEASEKMKKFILSGQHNELVNFRSQGKSFDLAIPTPEHYLPLLYTLGLQEKNEQISLFNDKAVAGALTMTSVKIG
jgi:4,5-DOPA dioxygenase extradiol